MGPAEASGPEAIAHAVRVLSGGGVVAFPTETVYGLGADALDGDAVARVFALKGRPAENPLIVHVVDEAMARAVVAEWPDAARTLAAAFWPGPMTLVLPKAGGVPGIVTGGGPTVGVRAPAHPLTLALIEALGRPLVGPSANRSGGVSPTLAEHVHAAFGGEVFVLDGGPCTRGIESTVVDLTADPPRVLRPGVIGADELARALGRPVTAFGSGADDEGQAAGPARAPGVVGPHYRPRAPVVLGRAGDPPEPGDRVVELPAEAAAAAACLYAELHRADAGGPARIVVVVPGERRGEAAVWGAVLERLGRASSG